MIVYRSFLTFNFVNSSKCVNYSRTPPEMAPARALVSPPAPASRPGRLDDVGREQREAQDASHVGRRYALAFGQFDDSGEFPGLQHPLPDKARASGLTSVPSVPRGCAAPTGNCISFRPPRFTTRKGTLCVTVLEIGVLWVTHRARGYKEITPRIAAGSARRNQLLFARARL